MEVSGLRDADVWAPLTAGDGDPGLYDSEEEEMGGASAFYVGRHEERRHKGFGGRGGVLQSSVGGGGFVGESVSGTWRHDVSGQVGKRAVGGSSSSGVGKTGGGYSYDVSKSSAI